MIAAFIGLDRLREAYETAKANGYRFYSFGDGIHLVRDTSEIYKKPPTG